MILLPDLLERVQAPRDTFTHESKNSAEIVRKYHHRKPRAIDQAGRLENSLVLLFALVIGECIRILPCVALVDVKELGGDILLNELQSGHMKSDK